jgi:hypothetical protein
MDYNATPFPTNMCARKFQTFYNWLPVPNKKLSGPNGHLSTITQKRILLFLTRLRFNPLYGKEMHMFQLS